MRIVSTTLTANASDTIADAIRSVVDWVDVCLIIDTGVTDDTLEVARSVAGSKFVCRQFPWKSDFAAARNFALEAAASIGDWAVTVDTDERIDLAGDDLRSLLASEELGVWMMNDETGTYAKERVFRLPSKELFSGPTHEFFPSWKVGHKTLPNARFRELTKTPEQLKLKFERDARILSKHTKRYPHEPRWFYYLGDTLQNLGQLDEAIAAYRACSALKGWNEESAWACYREAECQSAKGRFDKAVEACAKGLSLHAGVAELAWLAGFASYRAGHMDQAVWWARMSIPLGLFQGCGAQVKRIGFRNVAALYEGPYDVLRYALVALGDAEGAAEAERLYREARSARGAP